MLMTKLGKGLLVVCATAFLFACASSGTNTSDTKSTDTSNDVNETPISAPPELTPAEREAQRLAEQAAANKSARQARTVYFNLDDDTLTFEGRSIVEAHAWFLSKPENGGVVVTVEGHCDERGTPAYNLALGERRAKAIAQHLMLNGVASSQIRAVSHGEEKPADYGHDESAWSKNRRGVLDYDG